MTQHYRNGPPDPAEVLARAMDNLSRSSKRLGPILLVLVLVLLAAIGFFQVEPGEIAVIRTLGRETSRAEPGLHFRLPFVQQIDVVNVSAIRRLEIGFRGDQNLPQEALMLTGDENIVEAHLIVQYQVADPSKFLFRLDSPETVLHSAAEVALRGVIGRTTIDEAITRGRGEVQTETQKYLQELMNTYESGISVTEVKLQNVDPPTEVKDAFHDVVRAREEKEKLINQAKGYQEDVIPRARGEAERTLRQAEGYKEQRVARARGDAKKFDAVYAEYKKAERVTRRRLYLETMERVLDKVDRKTVLDGRLSQGALPFLPIGGKAQTSGGAQ